MRFLPSQSQFDSRVPVPFMNPRNPLNWCECGNKKVKHIKVCRSCTPKKIRDKKKYNKYQKQYMLNRYYRRQEKAIRQLGGACVTCGTKESLEFDHIDPITKEFTLAKGLATWAESRIQKELSKCQLLCKPCHIDKTRQDRK